MRWLTQCGCYCSVHPKSVQACVINIAVVGFDAQFDHIMRSNILRFRIFHRKILETGAIFRVLVFTKCEWLLVVFRFQSLDSTVKMEIRKSCVSYRNQELLTQTVNNFGAESIR